MSRPTLVLVVVLAAVIATFLLLVSVADEVVGSHAMRQLTEQSASGDGSGGGVQEENEEINLAANDEERPERQVNGTVRWTTKELIVKMAEFLGARKFVNEHLVRASVLLDAMLPNQSYIVLVPEDRAFDSRSTRANQMFANERDLIIGFHVVEGDLEQLYSNYMMSFANQHQRLPTLTGQNQFFSWRMSDNVLLASGAWVIDGIQKENVALLKIDQVLVPPAPDGHLWNIVQKSARLSEFAELVRSSGMQPNLTFPVQYTLFAPTNEAFNEMDELDRRFLKQDRGLARRFVKRHLCMPMIFKASAVWTHSGTWEELGLPEVNIRNLFFNESLRFKQSIRDAWYTQATFDINGVELPKEHELATNGVIYIIEGVL